MRGENQLNKLVHQKQYGQYFSGRKVANLLVSLLPDIHLIKTVIDPMAGVGDMLSAITDAGVTPDNIAGIEIDSSLIEVCRNNNSSAFILNGDAFMGVASEISDSWDLVITNPPYIRYQLMNATDGSNLLPSGKEVRKHLLKYLKSTDNLNDKERELFINIAKGYSGLADMAVPSWILCAAMVRPEGYLAMVVPETWLNRDYAMPIQYMLLKCFDVLTIARDTGAVWFDNVLVRTCLVVAKRHEVISLSESKEKDTYWLDLNPGLVGERSLVEKLKYGSDQGASALKELLRTRKVIIGTNFETRLENTYALFPNLLKYIGKSKWSISDEHLQIDGIDVLPTEIKSLLDGIHITSFVSLEELGWEIGQGLRTGANEFFYGTVISENSQSILFQSRAWYGKNFAVSKKNIVMTLQNRTEVDGLYIDKAELKKCVLYIQDQVRASDFDELSPVYRDKFSKMDEALEKYITEGEVYWPITGKTKKPFPELSAVSPNVRKDDSGYTRFWYMLPHMTGRHIPNLCISRLCGKAVECLYVNQSVSEPIAIDANFITLWHNKKTQRLIALALLNSTWFKCYMELTGTVMGGGALKLEASHLRQVRFPKYGNEDIHKLETCGKKICEEHHIDKKLQDAIDKAVLSPFGKDQSIALLNDIGDILQRKLIERGAI